MLKLIICVLFILQLTAQGSAKHKCPKKQVWDDCGTACPPTCMNPKPLICTLNCVVGCRCKDGLLTVKNKDSSISCIKKKKCPNPCKGKGGQVWKSCGTACPPRCSNPNPICTKQCVQGCQCPSKKPIFFRGKCIKEKKCPKCPKGQRWNECGTACPVTCGNFGIRPLPCPPVCVQGCQCEKGLIQYKIRGTKDFFCVEPDKCPGPPKGPCKGGMVWKGCGSACTPTCAQPNPFCTLQCVARCQCPVHKPIWHKRKCIAANDC